MKTVRNSLNYHYLDYKGERNSSPSRTVPDKAMTMREIYVRYVRGQPIAANSKQPIYEDPEVPSMGINPATLDFVDIQELAIKNKEAISDYKKRVENAEKAKQEIAQKQRDEALKAAWLAEQKPKN